MPKAIRCGNCGAAYVRSCSACSGAKVTLRAASSPATAIDAGSVFGGVVAGIVLGGLVFTAFGRELCGRTAKHLTKKARERMRRARYGED
jgi:hypothetical protein